MSDRRMLCLMLALASFSVLAYAHYDLSFGPGLTTRLEKFLGLPHLVVAVGIVLGALAVFVLSLVCVSIKNRKRDM